MDANKSSANWQLIRREDCCLIVIDVQTYFLGKLPLDWREPLVEKMA